MGVRKVRKKVKADSSDNPSINVAKVFNKKRYRKSSSSFSLILLSLRKTLKKRR
jgi:hypothetical protein